MEASIFQGKIGCAFSISPPKAHQTSILRCGQVSKIKCGKEGKNKVIHGLKLELEEELNEMRESSEKCKGFAGIVELLECLEREAIMGEDKGKLPTDYCRRAQIFAKSSIVFQALKHTSSA